MIRFFWNLMRVSEVEMWNRGGVVFSGFASKWISSKQETRFVSTCGWSFLTHCVSTDSPIKWRVSVSCILVQSQNESPRSSGELQEPHLSTQHTNINIQNKFNSQLHLGVSFILNKSVWHFCFCSHFSQAGVKDPKSSVNTKGSFLDDLCVNHV